MPTQLSQALLKRLNAPPWRRELSKVWRRLRHGCFDRYRPERHYMRGPGPRWHEKHSA